MKKILNLKRKAKKIYDVINLIQNISFQKEQKKIANYLDQLNQKKLSKTI